MEGRQRLDATIARALQCIHQARRYCPSYGEGLTWSRSEGLRALQRAVGLRTILRDLGDVPSVLLPMRGGREYRLLVDRTVNQDVRESYLIRHEIGHILAGDAEELLLFSFEPPLPEAEMVADLFAFADYIGDADLQQGKWWVEERLRRAVTLEYQPWYLRIPRIAGALGILRPLLRREALGLPSREMQRRFTSQGDSQ